MPKYSKGMPWVWQGYGFYQKKKSEVLDPNKQHN